MSSNSSVCSLVAKESSFVDESTECAICYDSLEARPVITLRCGHKWHLDCIVQQIEIGSMTASNDDKRLLFHGCQCGKCGSIFGEEDHPDLPIDLIRSTDKLRSKVHDLIDEHNLRNEMELVHAASGKCKDLSREALYKEAMRKYAFYLCSHCKDPYFGGTIACADGLGPTETESVPETRLCPACAPQSQTICQNPSEHGRYLTWKCRYCCSPSTHVCYGNVHFCDECHNRHSLGLPMEVIPCSGDSCPYPKPLSGEDTNAINSSNQRCCLEFHSNGGSRDCEQVYSCVLCDSIGASNNNNNSNNDNIHDPLAIEAGSRNFLVNPSGSEGLKGWRQLNGPNSWNIEHHHQDQSIPPLLQTPVLGSSNLGRPPITTNFVSSYVDCAMGQTVDLTKVLRFGNNALPRVVRIEISARYTGRTDCPSIFALHASLQEGAPASRGGNRQRPRILPPQRLSSGTLEAPPGVYWERTSLEFELDTTGNLWERPTITVIVMGKDRRFWQGNFGSKVADITLRVVGLTPEEMEGIIIPPIEANGVEDESRRDSNKPASQGEMIAAVGFCVLLWLLFF